MRSTDPTYKRGQSGQTLIEPLVASLLLGVAMIAGLTALDAATAGARLGVHQSWANCVARGEAGLVTAAAWSDAGYPAPANVAAVIDWSDGTGDHRLQRVTVTAIDPDPPHRVLTTFSVYKAQVLSGSAAAAATDAAAVATSCAGILRQT